MGFGHERPDAYRAAIEYVGWAYRFCEGLKGHRNAKDQLMRASQAIPLNVAEGNGQDIVDSDSDSDPDTDGRTKKIKANQSLQRTEYRR